MDAEAYLSERASAVNALLDRTVPGVDEPPVALHRAMRHLLLPGGKRLRPALACAAAEAVGAPPTHALPVAGAVELVHTYSLVHDDLPCMDDDLTRRGLPTVHVAFGEAVAVLAGDALLAAGFELLTGAPGSPELRLAALAELARAAGARHLVAGQVDDLLLSQTPAEAGVVEGIHRRKTAALFRAAVLGGGILGGAHAEACEGLRGFAEALGLAFQITDDLLDRDEDGACSLVRVIGAEAAGRRAEALLAEALAALEPFGERAEPLRELARYAVRRDR